MERPRPSSIAWGLVIGGAALWDIACPKNETLSERLDPICENPVKRRLLEASIAYTALHLTNHLPPQVDLFHHATKLKRIIE